MTADVQLARRWADFYRARGLNVLPGRPDAKRPFVRFARWWDEPAPADLIDRFPTPNLQIMTGRRWRLLVLDLDGPAARAWLDRPGRRVPRTWATHSGGDGLHLWFRLPAGLATPLPKAVLWRGEGPHQAAERLCDRSLILAPPSIHPDTGRRYRFLDRGHSPARLPLPADCPAWLLALPPRVAPRPATLPSAPPRRPRISPIGEKPGRYRAADVRAAIPDKAALAASWGLRLAGRPTPRGWVPCHAIGREDRHPSAAIHRDTGRYCDLGDGTRLGLFDLAVALGAYLDWREAVADLGASFRIREARA